MRKFSFFFLFFLSFFLRGSNMKRNRMYVFFLFFLFFFLFFFFFTGVTHEEEQEVCFSPHLIMSGVRRLRKQQSAMVNTHRKRRQRQQQCWKGQQHIGGASGQRTQDLTYKAQQRDSDSTNSGVSIREELKI